VVRSWLGGLDRGGWGQDSRDFCHCSTDHAWINEKWMDRLGIRFDRRLLFRSGGCSPRLCCAAVRAHVSHSTLLVSCRLSFFSPFPAFYYSSQWRLFAAAGRSGSGRAERHVNSDWTSWDGGGKRVIISQNMACFSAVHPKTVCASSEQEEYVRSVTSH